MEETTPDEKLWQSYVYHSGRCIFVSTINRTYDTAAGSIRGPETLVWEYDDVKRERGNLIGQMGGLIDHHNICRCFIATGEMLNEDNPNHQRFCTTRELRLISAGM